MSKFAKQSDEGSNPKRGLDFDVPVNCSICLELLNTEGPRAKARLQCGHEFHLDCIGSTFNVKGIMECPNCRDVEMGQWLYALGSEDLSSDATTNAWMAEHHPFFVMPVGFRLCLSHGIADRNNVPIGGHVFYGNHSNFVGQRPPPSPPQISNFASIFRPHPHSSLNPNDHRNGIQMNGNNHQPVLTLNPNVTQWNFHTTTVFFGHTVSSSQGGSSYIPTTANQNPSMNLFAFGGILAQYQLNNSHQPVAVSSPFPPGNIIRREFSAYNPTPYNDLHHPSTSYNPHPRGNEFT